MARTTCRQCRRRKERRRAQWRQLAQFSQELTQLMLLFKAVWEVLRHLFSG